MNHAKKITRKIIWLLPFIPAVSFAASLTDLIDSALKIITDLLIPLALALCVLYFFWGMVKYIRTGAASEEAAKQGKNIMVWGVVGIFVAFSIWGIISFIQSEMGLPPVGNPMPKKI